MFNMDDEVSDSAIIEAMMLFNVFLTPDTENPYLIEIGQRNNAPMQAIALSGRPKVLLGRKNVHSGDPRGAVACMAALLRCPISIT